MVKQKAVFFLRHYNDIDHIVPVIYKWLVMQKGPVDVVITSNPGYLNDYRIQFLRQYEDLQLHFIGDFLPEKQREQVYREYRINQMMRYHPIRVAYKIPKKIRNRFFPVRSRALYDTPFVERMLNELFKDVDRGIVVLDWIATGMMNTPQLKFVKPVISTAKARGFRAISLPHGDSPYHSRMETIDDLNYSGLNSYAVGELFDYVVVPNELCARRYRPHMDSNRIKVLGSPRFNDEWLNILAALHPRYETEKEEGKLKVVLFLRHGGYPIFWEEVMRTMRLVTQFSEVCLIVKPHTRNSGLQQLIKAYPELNTASVPHLEFVSDDVHSVSLLHWADMVIDLGNSVVYEAVKRGKPVLAMEYLHAGYSTIAYYMKRCAMCCRDDLYDTIQSFVENRHYQLYDDEERKRFIQEIVEVPDANVLERYVLFLERCLEQDAITKSAELGEHV